MRIDNEMNSSNEDQQQVSSRNMGSSEMDLDHLIKGDTDRLLSRTSNLLQNKSFTDVTFIVGPASHSKKYVGHRVLLAMTSPGESGRKVIRIPDLAPIGFENLLRYAYTDSLNLCSVEDSMLTAYAAKKYLLPHLLKECLSFIDKHVSASSACSVLEFAQVINSTHLLFQSLQVLDRNTYQVLGHKTLSGIQASTMALIASRPYLNLYSESSLISAAISWASAEVRRTQRQASTMSSGQQQQQELVLVRNILQEAGVLQKLRFLSLTPEEFAKVVLSTSTSGGSEEEQQLLLTKAEQVAIFMNISMPGIGTGLPVNICPDARIRSAPPDHFVVRIRPKGHQTVSKSISSGEWSGGMKFQVTSHDVIFVLGLVVPIRIEPSFYSVRAPKMDLGMRFTCKPGLNETKQDMDHGSSECQVTCVLSKDKDCVIRLRRPLAIRRGNMNEVTLTPMTTGTETMDIVVLRSSKMHKVVSSVGSGTEVQDEEGVTWLFFKPNPSNSSIELSELLYYY